MSWADAVAGTHLTMGPSDLDTLRLGMSVARVTVPLRARVDVSVVIEAIRQQAADLCIVRYPSAHDSWAQALQREEWRVLVADRLVYWELPVGAGVRPPSRATVEVKSPSDDVEVSGLVAEIFADYRSHYSSNPWISPDPTVPGYQEWAERSVDGGQALLVAVDDQPCGLATMEVAGGRCEVLLAGVVRSRQGQGLYPHLLAGVEDWADRYGATHVVISTQEENLRVQRAWDRFGFRPVASLTTIHVMPELEGAPDPAGWSGPE